MANITSDETHIVFGKPFGGDLCVEYAYSVGQESDIHPLLSDIKDVLPDNMVRLVGVRGNKEIGVHTASVVGMGVKGGHLYAITLNKVYRLVGPFYPDVIKNNKVLSSMWDDLKVRVSLSIR